MIDINAIEASTLDAGLKGYPHRASAVPGQ